jgi:Ca2+-binding RTX toxin-like protein
MTWFAPISSTTAINQAGDGNGVFIGPDVTLSGGSGTGLIRLSGANETAEIYGTVISTFLSAINLGTSSSAQGHTIHIYAGALVRSFDSGGVNAEGAGSQITNAGDVYGLLAGIYVNSSGPAAATLTNSGRIASDHNGVTLAYGASTGAFVLSNSGLIQGGDRSLYGGIGVDIVTNNGTMIGNVELGAGTDYYNGARGHLFGHLLAGPGLDTITGGADADWFEGGDGNDKLNGGLGNDRLFGGLNNDSFIFNTRLNASTNRDTIADFSHVDDTFQLENAVFTKLGAGVHALNPAFFKAAVKAADANDYIVYNRAAGLLSYDADGNGAHAAIAFAYLPNKPVLAANDFLVI